MRVGQELSSSGATIIMALRFDSRFLDAVFRFTFDS